MTLGELIVKDSQGARGSWQEADLLKFPNSLLTSHGYGMLPVDRRPFPRIVDVARR
jgi:hypothetical protein